MMPLPLAVRRVRRRSETFELLRALQPAGHHLYGASGAGTGTGSAGLLLPRTGTGSICPRPCIVLVLHLLSFNFMVMQASGMCFPASVCRQGH